MNNNFCWTSEDWIKMVNADKEIVYLQKKIIARILQDALIWRKESVNSNDEKIYFWIYFHILHLNNEDWESILKLNPFQFPSMIGAMDKIRQCSFRRIVKEMFIHDKRKPSLTEINAFERIFMGYPNPYGLETKFEKTPPLYPNYEWESNFEYKKTYSTYVTCW